MASARQGKTPTKGKAPYPTASGDVATVLIFPERILLSRGDVCSFFPFFWSAGWLYDERLWIGHSFS